MDPLPMPAPAQEEQYSILFSTYPPLAALQIGGVYIPFLADPYTPTGRFSYSPLTILSSKEELIDFWTKEAQTLAQALQEQAAFQAKALRNGKKPD